MGIDNDPKPPELRECLARPGLLAWGLPATSSLFAGVNVHRHSLAGRGGNDKRRKAKLDLKLVQGRASHCGTLRTQHTTPSHRRVEGRLREGSHTSEFREDRAARARVGCPRSRPPRSWALHWTPCEEPGLRSKHTRVDSDQPARHLMRTQLLKPSLIQMMIRPPRSRQFGVDSIDQFRTIRQRGSKLQLSLYAQALYSLAVCGLIGDPPPCEACVRCLMHDSCRYFGDRAIPQGRQISDICPEPVVVELPTPSKEDDSGQVAANLLT